MLTGDDVGKGNIDPVPEAEPAQKEGVGVQSRHPVGVPGDNKAEAMDRLNYDDLLVVKSSMESFTSKIHPVYGSLMVRALVSSMYKHAGHHDLCTIFKQVQTKVRKLCIDRNLGSGQLVVAWDTLTHMRQLYLFPGLMAPEEMITLEHTLYYILHCRFTSLSSVVGKYTFIGYWTVSIICFTRL
ncbi:hypothetical protein EB796_019296 [Bugula neritina]|uniref:Caspase family p10 domain-containing protein n=1 Tax=Bugula neritina TaxID=10212 RepID=A0A7J7J848_BUGNE|nr:hypothetical protein EB796_019296 [Bugula neritina]